ncbi:hypothetical protein TL16_g08266 [Triparma laevis f. inornata]|uniref:Uncharacterized protein n=1 Tax=Triparma laevis f. inornata TaxID=1714386 RepID=A0A9W7B4J0_9STRA|nr:hypothetical protein TL16_g08266 [Triparma laevis f. inornata]
MNAEALQSLRSFASSNPTYASSTTVTAFLDAAESHFLPTSDVESSTSTNGHNNGQSNGILQPTSQSIVPSSARSPPPQPPSNCLSLKSCIANSNNNEQQLLKVLESQIQLRLEYLLNYGVEIIEPIDVTDEEEEASKPSSKNSKKSKKSKPKPPPPPSPSFSTPSILPFLTRTLQILQTPPSSTSPFPYLLKTLITSFPPQTLMNCEEYRKVVEGVMEKMEFDFEWDDHVGEREEEVERERANEERSD